MADHEALFRGTTVADWRGIVSHVFISKQDCGKEDVRQVAKEIARGDVYRELAKTLEEDGHYEVVTGVRYCGIPDYVPDDRLQPGAERGGEIVYFTVQYRPKGDAGR